MLGILLKLMFGCGKFQNELAGDNYIKTIKLGLIIRLRLLDIYIFNVFTDDGSYG